MVMSFNHKDQILWPVYITIQNLDAKIQQSQKRSGSLILGFILNIHKQLEDSNNKNKDFKAKIYYIVLNIIL